VDSANYRFTGIGDPRASLYCSGMGHSKNKIGGYVIADQIGLAWS
jgi:hypothetical protein